DVRQADGVLRDRDGHDLHQHRRRNGLRGGAGRSADAARGDAAPAPRRRPGRALRRAGGGPLPGAFHRRADGGLVQRALPARHRARRRHPAMKLALTGSGGWIGGRLRDLALDRGIDTRVVRARAGTPIDLPEADVMIHVGGIAHDLGGEMDEAAYRAANAELPVELARRCAEAGYGRFVFVSSAKVIGDATTAPADEETVCRPTRPYARAKLDAERGLATLAAQLGIEVTVVRPPLVYGPGVGANFARLLRFADGAWPWPTSPRGARRSLVY